MTTPTPRELDPAELAAIRERVDSLRDTDAAERYQEYADMLKLVDHMDALAARCRAYEAALRVIAAHGDDRNLSVMRSTWTTSDAYSDVKEMAAAALAANDGSARDGNGEAG